ncbi:alpha/beta fold hydrolase [Microbacterium paludicola]|uniref:alpha/beta fold hydrolase n=1 Tax=Microbacterium paludicola TaxID=300019 RepID=UPI0031CE2A93
MIPDERVRLLFEAAARERGRTAPAQPPAAPSPGEAIDDWRGRVESARHAADAHAVAHRAAVDRAAQRLFGSTASEILAHDDSPLVRSTFELPVPAAHSIGEVVRQLDGRTPAGPGPRVPGVPAPVRVTLTAPARPSGGAILQLHGGAFWMGGGDAATRIDELLIEHLARATGATVLSIDHRLAPEHPFPAAIIDALCVLDAVRHGRIAADIDPARLALVGTSSGSNIATVAAMADAAAHPAHRLAALVLIAPSMLLHRAPPTMRANPHGWEMRQRQLRGYLGDAVAADDRWVSPGVADELPGMPPTLAVIAAYDEIAMGGHELCAAIASGGSPARAREYPMTHTVAPPDVEAAIYADIAEFLSPYVGAAGAHHAHSDAQEASSS